ncbi:MAG TPA: septal ring lytic transglycosylase RlpA family protein [Terriglobales bacterium]|nr:septal ring lytic transglycosylase RlpA family protein [Terriglobales bacterium]
MRRVLPFTLAILLLVATLGAAPASNSSTRSPANTPSAENAAPKPYQVGKASWYGKQFHGKTTASGEAYDMFQFTAAHRQLPLGTWVKVTNMRNGRWLIVRVNDRGPVPTNRIIDLSYGAAQMLEFRAKGIEKVRLDLLPAQPTEVAVSRPVPVR